MSRRSTIKHGKIRRSRRHTAMLIVRSGGTETRRLFLQMGSGGMRAFPKDMAIPKGAEFDIVRRV